MAQEFATVEVWIVVDAAGDSASGRDLDEAKEHYTEQIGALEDSEGFRSVCVKVKVPLPEVCTLEVEAEAPEMEAPSAA